VSKIGPVHHQGWSEINGQCCWDILLYESMLDAIKCVVDDNFVFQQDSAPGVFCIQQKNSQLPFSCVWACNSPELNSIDYEI